MWRWGRPRGRCRFVTSTHASLQGAITRGLQDTGARRERAFQTLLNFNFHGDVLTRRGNATATVRHRHLLDGACGGVAMIIPRARLGPWGNVRSLPSPERRRIEKLAADFDEHRCRAGGAAGAGLRHR